METVTFPDAAVKEKLSQFVLVHINTDEDKATAGKYGVGGIPDIRVMKSDGTSVHQVLGFSEPGAFIQELETGLAKAK